MIVSAKYIIVPLKANEYVRKMLYSPIEILGIDRLVPLKRSNDGG